MKYLTITLWVIMTSQTLFSQGFDLQKMREKYEKRQPQLDTMVATPQAFGMHYEQVEAVTIDDIKIAGWFIPAQKNNGTILMVHGFNMNKSHMLERAKLFSDLDISVLLIDLRARGESGGDKTSTGGASATDILTMAELYYKKYSKFGKLTFYGFSHGGRAVLFAASQSVRQQDLILESPPYSLTESFKRTYRMPQVPNMDEGQGMEEAMTKMVDKNILLLIGDSDPAIIEIEAEELIGYSQASKSKLVIYTATKHHVFTARNLGAFQQEVTSFLAQQ